MRSKERAASSLSITPPIELRDIIAFYAFDFNRILSGPARARTAHGGDRIFFAAYDGPDAKSGIALQTVKKPPFQSEKRKKVKESGGKTGKAKSDRPTRGPFFEVQGGKFAPRPGGSPGQTSAVRITHTVTASLRPSRFFFFPLPPFSPIIPLFPIEVDFLTGRGRRNAINGVPPAFLPVAGLAYGCCPDALCCCL